MRFTEEQIKAEILGIMDVKMYDIYNGNKGHSIQEHVQDKYGLNAKLWDMPKQKTPYDIVMATSFFSEEEAVKLIAGCLLRRVGEITEWHSSDPCSIKEISVKFRKEVGFGFVKKLRGTFHVHGLRIILAANDQEGRSFYVKTAYPVATTQDRALIREKLRERQRKSGI